MIGGAVALLGLAACASGTVSEEDRVGRAPTADAAHGDDGDDTHRHAVPPRAGSQPVGAVFALPSYAPPAPPACPADVSGLRESPVYEPSDPRLKRRGLIVVDKPARRLMVFDGGNLSQCFKVGLGFSPAGHKEVEGDGKTPEGWYRTSDKPWSTFDHAISIHYPAPADAKAGYASGRIRKSTRDKIVQSGRRGALPPQRTALGGAILIHGGGSSTDWTLGCVALDDADLLTLRQALPKGQRTDIVLLP